MKKAFILLVLIMHSLLMHSFVIVNVDSLSHANSMHGYDVNIVDRGSKLQVTYVFDSIAIVKDPIINGSYNVFIAGFGNSTEEGRAALPTLLERFSVPPGFGYTITNINAKYIYLNKNLAPARPIIPENSEWSFTTVPFKLITLCNDFEPVSPVSDNGVQTFRKWPLANVEIMPVSYNANLHRLRVCTELHFDIEYTQITSSSDFEYDEDTELYVKSITLQPETAINRAAPMDLLDATKSEVDYLIITATSLNKAAQQIAAWKRKIGYTVHVFSKSSWDKNEVLEAISMWHHDMKNPRYVLFIGDEELISPYEMTDDSYNTKIPSDFKYACMDGESDNVADIFLGRIPCSNLEEAENAVKKILSYETNPIGDMSETKVVYSTFFQDQDYLVGYEDRDFSRTTELIFNAFPNKFDQRKRIYYCNSNVTPLHWSKSFSYGGDVPQELRKPTFAWDGDAGDIIEEINSGCNLFFHRDHGAIDGWGDPKFRTSDLSQLENTVYPIIFSIDCLTGKYNVDNNFAKTLLCMPDAGCASIIAASGVTYSGYNDAMACSMFGSLFPEAKFVYNDSPNINRNAELFNGRASSIGEMLNIGLINMERQYRGGTNTMALQRSRYHCFGDPSLSVCWDSSNLLKKNASITEFGGFITVDLGGYRAYISFFDKTSSKSKRVYGNYATFESENPQDVEISIMLPGYIPVIGAYADLATIGTDNPKPNYIESYELADNLLKVKLSINFEPLFGLDAKFQLCAYLQSKNSFTNIATIDLVNYQSPIAIRLPETQTGDIIRLKLIKSNAVVDKKNILIKK